MNEIFPWRNWEIILFSQPQLLNCLIVNTKWIYPGPGIEFSPDGQNINIHTLLTFNVFFQCLFYSQAYRYLSYIVFMHVYIEIHWTKEKRQAILFIWILLEIFKKYTLRIWQALASFHISRSEESPYDLRSVW